MVYRKSVRGDRGREFAGMSYKPFYRLLQKYDGNLDRAQQGELKRADYAALAGGSTPFTALRLAREKYAADSDENKKNNARPGKSHDLSKPGQT